MLKYFGIFSLWFLASVLLSPHFKRLIGFPYTKCSLHWLPGQLCVLVTISLAHLFSLVFTYIQPCFHPLSPFFTRCHQLSPIVTRCHPLSPVVTGCHRFSRIVTHFYQFLPVFTCFICFHCYWWYHPHTLRNSIFFSAFRIFTNLAQSQFSPVVAHSCMVFANSLSWPSSRNIDGTKDNNHKYIEFDCTD